MVANNSINTGKAVYRAVVIALGLLPVICITLIAGVALMMILYVFGGFIMVAIE